MKAAAAVTDVAGIRPRAGTKDIGDRWLGRCALVFSVAVILHNSDHLRRGAELLRADVFSVGTAGIVLEVALVVLICQRHRLAPLAAAAGGLGLAAGYVEVHFLPAHRWLSESFTSAAHVSPLSWTAASLEVIAALGLALTGLAVLGPRGGLRAAFRPHPAQLGIVEAIGEPLALVMILSQSATIIVSFVQAFR